MAAHAEIHREGTDLIAVHNRQKQQEMDQRRQRDASLMTPQMLSTNVSASDFPPSSRESLGERSTSMPVPVPSAPLTPSEKPSAEVRSSQEPMAEEAPGAYQGTEDGESHDQAQDNLSQEEEKQETTTASD